MTIYERSVAGPLFSILDRDRFPPSVANLPAALTINGTTVYPTFRYNGKDATATTWPAWGYGETLTLTGTGTAPTYNNGSPLLGSVDDSVKFNGVGGAAASGKGFVSGENANGNVGTNDFVFESVLSAATSIGASVAGYVWCKGAAAAPYNIVQAYNTGGETLLIHYLGDGANSATVTSGAEHPLGVYIHAMLVVDRSGSAQWYINGVASGAAVNVSAVSGAVTSAASGLIGAYSTSGDYGFGGNVLALSLWQGASWLDTHLQATVAKTRFAQLTGVYPQQARGTALPTAMARTTAAYLDKIEADGSTKLYYVGANWPRVCSRKDTNGNVVRGYLPETAATNVCLQSQTFATTPWTTTGFNATVPTTAVVCPDGITRTTNTLHEDSSAAIYHGISQSRTLTAAVYTFSVFAKAAARSWLRLSGQNVVDVAFFDLSNGIVGYVANATSGMRPVGNGWYHCWITWTADALERPSNIFVAEGDNDVIFNGLNQDSLYIYGAQTELGNYPSTYIPTTTAAVTRTADSLRYKMDDGNLAAGKGSLVVDFMGANANPTTEAMPWTVSDGSATYRMYMSVAAADYQHSNFVGTNVTTQWNMVGATHTHNGNKHTIRATWKTNQARQYVDGVIDGTEDTVCTIPTGLTRLDVGAYLSSGYEANGLISNLEIYGTPTLKAKPSNGR